MISNLMEWFSRILFRIFGKKTIEEKKKTEKENEPPDEVYPLF